MAKQRPGPGLAKVRKGQILSRRTIDVLALREGWWSSVLETADVMSEGEVIVDGGRATYFGTTSLRCGVDDELATSLPKATPELLGRIILADPHARLRLVRLAHREAASRANAPLDVLRAEMAARILRKGGRTILSVDIDVSALIATEVASDR